MTARSLVLGFALFGMLFWNMRCQSITSNAFGGGGTETGNPGMIACAHAIFEELSGTSHQSPQTYLPHGEYDLDPGRIFRPEPRRASPFKTSVADTDTVLNYQQPVIPPKDTNTNILKCVYSVDTIVSVSTLFIKDTVAIDSVKNDTVPSSSKDFAVIVKRRIRGIIYISDTVAYRRDTVLKPRIDSTFLKFSNSKNAVTQTVTDTVPGTKHVIKNVPSVNTDSLVVDSVCSDHIVCRIPAKASLSNMFGSGFVLPGSGFTIQSKSGYSQFIRESKPFGSALYERYEDGDGDGLLYSPETGSMRSRLSGKYENGGAVDTLSVVFDAGADKIFPTTADNRILSLTLNRRNSCGELLETVTYAPPAADSAHDTVALTLKQHAARRGLVRDATVTYYCLKGIDPLDHRRNKVTKLTQAFSFSDGIVQSLETTVTFDTPTGPLQPYSDANVTATLSYGKTQIALFEGRLNMKDRSLCGTYTENGVVYRCYYERGIDMLFWGQTTK